MATPHLDMEDRNNEANLKHRQDADSNNDYKTNLADPTMLEKIDKLFACNVGHYIDLPQIVVVGDQSSGKSSVLAGLMDLPFPRDSGLCTRFATQILFRRAPESRIAVSIIPAKDSSAEHEDQVRAWNCPDLRTLNAKSFSDIMKEVSGSTHLPAELMMLAGPCGYGFGRTTRQCVES